MTPPFYVYHPALHHSGEITDRVATLTSRAVYCSSHVPANVTFDGRVYYPPFFPVELARIPLPILFNAYIQTEFLDEYPHSLHP